MADFAALEGKGTGGDGRSNATLNGSLGPVTGKVGANTNLDLVRSLDLKREAELGLGVPGLRGYVKGGLKTGPGPE